MIYLFLLFLFLLLYYLIFLSSIYQGLGKLSSSPGVIPDEFVTIIVPFRNEEENILNNLRSLEVQNYPAEKYEIIYVNDASTDCGPSILQNNILKKNVRFLNLTTEDSSFARKKKAIAYGISCASGDIIVTTDADCIYHKNWLRAMVSCYDKKTAMIAGSIELYNCRKFFQKLQQVEFAGLITAGAGLIGSNTPVICNAANLSYRKKIFNELNGFSDNLHLASGDDEFLMQSICSKTDYQIKFCTAKESIVKTRPGQTLNEFFQQRKRWASKGLHYENKNLIIKLILIFLFYLGIAVQVILSFFSGLFLISLTASILLKGIFEYSILSKGKKLLFDNITLKYFIPAEILHIPYILITSIAGTIGNFEWKGRKVKR